MFHEMNKVSHYLVTSRRTDNLTAMLIVDPATHQRIAVPIQCIASSRLEKALVKHGSRVLIEVAAASVHRSKRVCFDRVEIDQQATLQWSQEACAASRLERLKSRLFYLLSPSLLPIQMVRWLERAPHRSVEDRAPSNLWVILAFLRRNQF